MPKRKCSSVVKSFGQNLIYYRTQCGLTQQEVADKLNLNRSTYTKYETSVSEPSLEILLKIADIFGVDPNQLLDTERTKNVADSKKTKISVNPKEEKIFVNSFRMLDSSQKKEVFNTMSKFINENGKK